MILPFSNKITGPISSPTGGPCSADNNSSSSSSSSLFSGSGSGSVFDNSSNFTDTNSTDFCEMGYEIGVNENSISRVPLKVWAILLTVMVLLAISRYVLLH